MYCHADLTFAENPSRGIGGRGVDDMREVEQAADGAAVSEFVRSLRPRKSSTSTSFLIPPTCPQPSPPSTPSSASPAPPPPQRQTSYSAIPPLRGALPWIDSIAMRRVRRGGGLARGGNGDWTRASGRRGFLTGDKHWSAEA